MKAINIILRAGMALCLGIVLNACEGDLEFKEFQRFEQSSFFKNADEAQAAVNALYSPLYGGGFAGYGFSETGWSAQSDFMAGQLTCTWSWDGWDRYIQLNLSEDFSPISDHYNRLIPQVSRVTYNLGKVEKMEIPNAERKAALVSELKALRAQYSWVLYNLYGPVPIRVNPDEAGNPKAAPIPRPSSEWMVSQIEKDYKEALAGLPSIKDQGDANWGRFSKNSCLMGLLKLYMHEKRWQDAIGVGHQMQELGWHNLNSNYADNFRIETEGRGNKEIILPISCQISTPNTNIWYAYAMPGNYADPSGVYIEQWGGYKIPWNLYDRFDKTDKRRERIWESWRIGNGTTFNGRTAGYKGAQPIKYGLDPAIQGTDMGTDVVIWRWADAILLLSEALNEVSGPNQESYDLLKSIRTRAGLSTVALSTFTKDTFRKALMDERFFELWAEGVAREDYIRWGILVSNAKANGSIFAKDEFVLYPIPRSAITASGGIIKQNPGY